MLGKALIFAALSMVFRYRNVIPLALGLGLSQIGEFSFVLGQVGVATHSISPEFYSLVLITTIVTMLLTPLISGLTAPFYALWGHWFKPTHWETFHFPRTTMRDHFIIAGGGRVGNHVATVLNRVNLPFIIIELNSMRVDLLKKANYPILVGDATKEIILKAAQVEKAKLLLITTPSSMVSQTIAAQAKKLNPDIHMIARAEGIEEMQGLHDQGVFHLVQPEFEASLEFAHQALRHMDIPSDQIAQYTDSVRQELYRPLYDRDEL